MVMRELAEVGYAEMTQQRGPGGRFMTGYTVYAERQVQGGEAVISPGAVTRGAVSRGAVPPDAVVEAFEVEPREEKQPQRNTKALARRAAPEAGEIQRDLKSELHRRGVTSLPRDWHLKVDAVLDRWLREGAEPDDIRAAIGWGLTHPWFGDKMHDP